MDERSECQYQVTSNGLKYKDLVDFCHSLEGLHPRTRTIRRPQSPLDELHHKDFQRRNGDHIGFSLPASIIDDLKHGKRRQVAELFGLPVFVVGDESRLDEDLMDVEDFEEDHWNEIDWLKGDNEDA